MTKKVSLILTAFLLLGVSQAAAVVTPGGPDGAYFPAVEPHGYPQTYSDGHLTLELCLENTTMCFFDPVEPGNAFSEANGFGPEAFYFLAEAELRDLPPAPDRADRPGRAVLVLGLEAAFGGDEAVEDGNQVAFGRVRVRIDTAQPGDYRVIHPYGVNEFLGVPAGRRAIDYTQDIGGVNPGNPAAAFSGAGASSITRFLTWPEFEEDDRLRIDFFQRDENGELVLDEDEQPVIERTEQYIGHPDIPHVVTGSPFDTNVFRIEYRANSQAAWTLYGETDLFAVHGRIYGGVEGEPKGPYVNVPEQKLLASGPVNRAVAYSTTEFGRPTDGEITGELFDAFPKGFPLWYQEDAGTEDEGLVLTLCPGGNPMCISEPIDFGNPGSRELGVGGEAFWWSAFAEVVNQQGISGTLDLALEAAFGGDEAIEDGNQVAFGRVRIRIDTPQSGNYRVIHPYGEITFTNVPVGIRAINYTQDIGGVNPFDPDSAFAGALHSAIGPTFLVWHDFDYDLDPELMPEELVKTETFFDEDGLEVEREVIYVGDPAIGRQVKGSPTGNNFFRIEGPGGRTALTDEFFVSGKVYHPETFQVSIPAGMPAAQNDVASTIATAPVIIDVLANDSIDGELISTIPGADVTVALLDAPSDGAAELGNNVFTYTADPGFQGNDSFTYTVTNNATGQTSSPGTVTVTVLPEESITVTRARLELGKLRWDIRGEGNITTEGEVLTIRLGSPTGTVLDTVTVRNGSWNVRATTQGAPPTGQVQIYVISDRGTMEGPVAVQVR